MTVVLLGIAALVRALRERGAGLIALVAAPVAVLVDRRTGWIIAAAIVLQERDERPLDLVGLAALAVAAVADNVAAVLPAFALASACARRRSIPLLASDLCVAAAILWVALEHGFATWPVRAGMPVAILLAAAALARVSVNDWAIRPQAMLLLVWALQSDRSLAPGMALAGAVVAAGGAFAHRPDLVQEMGLVAVALVTTSRPWLVVVATSAAHLLREWDVRRHELVTVVAALALIGPAIGPSSAAGTITAAGLVVAAAGLLGPMRWAARAAQPHALSRPFAVAATTLNAAVAIAVWVFGFTRGFL